MGSFSQDMLTTVFKNKVKHHWYENLKYIVNMFMLGRKT